MAKIPATELDVFPLCLGGNVFGWTADETASFAVLDAYAEAGGNFIDTADVYSAWAPGNQGGESETIIGRWMKARANRQKMIIATKVGKHPRWSGLAPATIRAGLENSLERLQTDYIDLYYSHADDPAVSLQDTLSSFQEAVEKGKVRYAAASNYSGERLVEAAQINREHGWRGFIALQPHYNLLERARYENGLRAAVQTLGLVSFPYFALASGFLTGKYRSSQIASSRRSELAQAYANDHGFRVVAALEKIAASRGTKPATVALAWLLAQPTVAAPIASAREVEQLPELLAGTTLRLNPEDLTELDRASAL